MRLTESAASQGGVGAVKMAMVMELLDAWFALTALPARGTLDVKLQFAMMPLRVNFAPTLRILLALTPAT